MSATGATPSDGGDTERQDTLLVRTHRDHHGPKCSGLTAHRAGSVQASQCVARRVQRLLHHATAVQPLLAFVEGQLLLLLQELVVAERSGRAGRRRRRRRRRQCRIGAEVVVAAAHLEENGGVINFSCFSLSLCTWRESKKSVPTRSRSQFNAALFDSYGAAHVSCTVVTHFFLSSHPVLSSSNTSSIS